MDSPSRIFLVNIFFTFFLWQVVSAASIAECHPAKTCGSCMRIDPRCSWCKDTNTSFSSLRCDDRSTLDENGCEDILTKRSTLKIIENEAVKDPVFIDDSDVPQEEAVPISPQVVRLTLRRGDTQTIKVRVRQVSDYPVDLYYLMDLSNSMEDDLRSIQGIGSALAKRMRGITRSFALGFGSFVDKPVSPYINAIHALKDVPSCSPCEKAYSFRNELSLNQNESLFNDKVSSTLISGNEDEAEGTLDAVMQSVVCEDIIGWRNESRRLLLVTTDAPFHIEGDGKMAGILTPNDGRCHLEEGSYKTSHLYDYPSIGQLNDILVKNNIILIFAISGTKTRVYQDLAHIIQGAIFAKLTSNSSNIVNIIADKYEEITGNIKVTYSRLEGLDVRISSNCSQPPDSAYALECSEIHDGGEIEFDVNIKATRCMNESFEIYPIGFDKRLTISVSVVCNCSCEFAPEVNSSDCSGFGNAVCGVCECLPGHYGDSCECTGEGDEGQDKRDKERFCKPDNQTNVLCSGQGECICGECRCHQSADSEEVISGTYCECNNQACPLEDGEVCGGSERGECVCGLDQRTNECQCKPGYTGETCSCPTQTDTCRSSNGRICNGEGDCECGRCICRPGSKYSGPRCDECLTCTECDRYTDCVECYRLDADHKPPNDICASCVTVYQIHNVTELPQLNDTGSCTLTNTENCSISFLYENSETENGTINIYIQAGEDCPHSDTTLVGIELHLLILYIVLGIILIGLLLILIYRFYTWYLDRKEYQLFLAEKENAQWEKSDNPIYTTSTRKYVNPMYGK